MTPETLIYFGIISGEPTLSSELIKNLKKRICGFISQDTISTVNNSIKLSRSMKTKTIFIVYSFSSGDVFSPAKLYFISISIDFWRSLNRMPNGILRQFRYMMKDFSYLLFLDLYLFFVGNWEPSTSSIDLKMLRKRYFERGFFDHIEYLSLDAIGTIFDYSYIDDASRDCSSWDKYFFTRSWVDTESGSSEYEFIDGDIWDNLIFLHGNMYIYKIISFFLCFAWGSEKFSSLSYILTPSRSIWFLSTISAAP